MLSVMRMSHMTCKSQRLMLTAQSFISQSPIASSNGTIIKVIRQIGNNTRGRVSTQTLGRTETRRRTIKEVLMAPATETPFAVGKGMVAGAALFGVGALCYYGLGLSHEPGVYERSMGWPQYVRDRIHSTYLYFGSGIGITAASAAAAFRSPTMMRLMTKNSIMAIVLTIGAMIGTSIIAQSIPYKDGFGVKQLAWMTHCGVVGTVIAPLCILGGPIMLRAAIYTAGIVGGLSSVAVCAPSEKFLNMGGPLAIGLGVVFASAMGSMFLPATTALGAGLYSISLYGGLVLFSGFLLYDTQRIVKKAEIYPLNANVSYDPINASMSIYMDAINIFVRMAIILSGGGNKRR